MLIYFDFILNAEHFVSVLAVLYVFCKYSDIFFKIKLKGV